jgi:hypothetical protein
MLKLSTPWVGGSFLILFVASGCGVAEAPVEVSSASTGAINQTMQDSCIAWFANETIGDKGWTLPTFSTPRTNATISDLRGKVLYGGEPGPNGGNVYSLEPEAPNADPGHQADYIDHHARMVLGSGLKDVYDGQGRHIGTVRNIGLWFPVCLIEPDQK